jgi:uncharacterized membrane protein
MLSTGGQYKKCLKCGHQRTAADQGPDWGCPACGAVYAKVEAALAARQALEAEEAEGRLASEARRLERAARGGGRGRATASELDHDDRKGLAQLGYLLLATPIIASLITAFVSRGGGRHGAAGWPMLALIAGVVLAYVVLDKEDETWVDTHFRWQISTFWRMVGWSVGAAVLLYPVMALTTASAVRSHDMAGSFMAFGGVAIVFGLAFFVIGLLYFIRIVRGWVSLNRGKEIGV